MKTLKDIKQFLILWSTQSLSQLGSNMTSFALTLWLFDKTGSALETALLSVCTYAPYVIMSIFAGAISDKWDKKKTMLLCDTFAVFTTIAILIMLKTDTLMPWHLYLLNAINGLMNTVQRPASEVTYSLIVPKEHYQKISGIQSFSNSVITILNPIISTAVYTLLGMYAIILIDISTFAVAFIALMFFVNIPKASAEQKENESVLTSAKQGLVWLKQNPMILQLILFLSTVNFIDSAFNAVLPPLVLLNYPNGQSILGAVTAFAGIGTLFGSIIATFMKKPKNRVRVICFTMLFSLGTENFILAFTDSPVLWCIAQFIGWCFVPVMSANYSVIFRNTIPVDLQGRVYACRNTLQFFTIPLGLLFGGFMVDNVAEPMLCLPFLQNIFGNSDGSRASLIMFILGILGTSFCLVFSGILRKYKFHE